MGSALLKSAKASSSLPWLLTFSAKSNKVSAIEISLLFNSLLCKSNAFLNKDSESRYLACVLATLASASKLLKFFKSEDDARGTGSPKISCKFST